MILAVTKFEASSNRFGPINWYTTNCASRIFMRGNTNWKGWYHPYFDQAIVRALKCAPFTYSIGYNVIWTSVDVGKLNSTWIISNGVGNLIWAKTNKWCSVGHNVEHISANAPWQGNGIAANILLICMFFSIGLAMTGWGFVISIPINVAIRVIGLCAGFLAPVGLSASQPSPVSSRARDIKKEVFRRLCGDGGDMGSLNFWHSLIYTLAGGLWTPRMAYDGIITLPSCTDGETKNWGRTWRAFNYLSDTSHSDGACLNGNHATDHERKPCNWIAEATYQKKGVWGTKAPTPRPHNWGGYQGGAGGGH
jgi:hypothetical protein